PTRTLHHGTATLRGDPGAQAAGAGGTAGVGQHRNRDLLRIRESQQAWPAEAPLRPFAERLRQRFSPRPIEPNLRRLAAGIVVALFSCSPAAAQRFGQWSWDGIFGASQRAYQNFVDDEKASAFDQRDLKFSFGVNGFILHPAVARFRVGLDGLFSGYEGSGRAVDTDRWGLRGNLQLFPIGKYRINVFAARQLYDYSGITEEDPLTLRGIPDTSATWGGRLRVRGGRLSGTLVGVERTSLDFLDPEADQEVHQREFVDWSGGQKLQRHIRLERRLRDFGAVDFKTDTVTANFDQHGNLSPSWQWNLFGIATHQKLSFNGGTSSTFDTVRVRNQLLHPTRGNDLLDLGYTGGLFRSDSQDSSQSHSTSARYRWRLNQRWEVSPFVAFGLRLSEEFTLRSPQVGVSTTWSRSGQSMDLSLTNSASYVLVQRSGKEDSQTDSLLGLGASASLGHGEESNLRKELEGSWSRNQLRLGGEAIVDVPGFVAPLVGGGTEDVLRGRLTLRRRWRSVLFSGYGDWSRREPSGELFPDRFSADAFTVSLQLSGSRFSFLANLGNTRVRQDGSQGVRFRSTSLSFRPWRTLALHASYRTDTRRLVLAPDVDGHRAEAGVELRFGAFALQARAFMTTERQFAVTERTNRGVTWALSRRFQGWLPIVTRGPARGSVR
ncbi:MAG: hypothetical protein ACE5JI_09425, partial [Acidobacteriota bacterium]